MEKRVSWGIIFLLIVAVSLLVFISTRIGDEPRAQVKTPNLAASIMLTTQEIKWVDGPKSLPSGAKFALIEGNLSNAEPFTFRLLFPSNYTLAPHWHPAVEHVTVISGTLYFGEGNESDFNKTRAFSAGSVMFMPIGVPMFGYAKEETIIQVHGTGPWGINYVNPAEDPRKK